MSLARYLSKLGALLNSDGKVPQAGIADEAVSAAKLAPGAAASNLVSYVSSVDGTAGAVTLTNLAAFAKSLGTNGYQKLPGGLIIQWGSFTTTASQVLGITFPIAFSSACYSVTTALNNASVTTYFSHHVANLSTTGMTVYNAQSNATLSGFYIAIGS